MLKPKQIPAAIKQLIPHKNRGPKVLIVFWGSCALLVLSLSMITYAMMNLSRPKPVVITKPEPVFIIRAEAYKDLKRLDEGNCAGTFQVTNLESGESNFCTHGPEVTFRNAVKRGSEIRVPGKGVQCTGDGTSGLRIQAIYAHAEDKPDRYDELQGHFQAIADNVSNAVAASAQKTGGEATLKWVTDPACNITIAKVKLRANQDDSFSETINAVQRADFDDPSKKYLIWTEADLVCGIATFITHDVPNPDENYNSSGISSSYGRIDRSCWGESELHEIMHMMGAVQDSTPHSTKRGHCTDGYEVMCYGDGGLGTQTASCDIIKHRYLLDCNNDDYFSANPAPGSYLASHWNIFNSNYLITNKTKAPDPTDTTPPPKPTNVEVYDIRQDGFRIKWKLPSTADIKKIHVEVNRAIKVVLQGPATETYSFASLKPSTAYKARVVTIDANNNQSISEEVSFTTLATPPAASAAPEQLGSIIPHSLKIKSINGAVVTLTAVIDRIPDSSTQYVIWRSTGVGHSGYSYLPTNTSKTYEFVDERVYPQTVSFYYIKVQRADGGEIARSEEIPLNFTGTHESNPPPAPTGFAIKQNFSGAYYIQYDQMIDDSGLVHHYSHSVSGPNGYTYNQSTGDEILSFPNAQSGQSYTATTRVYDIWGNASSPTVTTFTMP